MALWFLARSAIPVQILLAFVTEILPSLSVALRIHFQEFMKGMRTYIMRQAQRLSPGSGKTEDEVFLREMQRLALMVAAYRRKVMCVLRSHDYFGGF